MKNGIQYFVVGLCYKNADLLTRGKFTLNKEQTKLLLEQAKADGLTELMVNSTCNRTEIYGIISDPNLLISYLCEFSEGDLECFREKGYVLEGKEAINHVFRVGCGLESQILGDFEIIGQLKKSFYFSKKHKMVNGFSERLVNSVIQSSKRIKTETEISTGATSVSFASVHYILENVDEVSHKNILLFGTGKIGRNTCENLIKHTQNEHVVLINRTEESAQKIAGKFNLIYKKFDHLKDEIKKTDIMIVATSADYFSVTPELINSEKPLLILDLSMPSNVDPKVKLMESVTLINLDELSQMTNATLVKREKIVPIAEQILSEVRAEFLQWIEHRKFAPTLKALKNKLLYGQSQDLPDQDDFSQTVNRLAGRVASYLKENPSKADETLSMLQDLYQLDSEIDA